MLRSLAMCVAFAVCCSRLCAEPVHVVCKPPVVERRTFDPSNPPKEMPPLKGDEAAVTASDFAVSAELSCRPVSETPAPGCVVAQVLVDSVNLTATLRITIWLPVDAPRALVEHEDGHRAISESFYADAERICREAAASVLGRTLRGTGATAAEARHNAIRTGAMNLSRQCVTAMQTPSAEVNSIFDRITDHGRRKIPVDEAVRRAMNEYRARTGS